MKKPAMRDTTTCGSLPPGAQEVGSKNGSAFTATPTCLRSWFTVNSISSFVPGAASSADSVASAIIFFRVGDQVLLVTSDFLATGGGGVLAPIMPADGFPVDAGAPLVRDVLVEYLRRHAPDVVVLTSLTYSRSQQLDVLKAARQLDIPVAAAVMSWDHLSSKALLHIARVPGVRNARRK